MTQEIYSIPDSNADGFDFQRNAFEMLTANFADWNIPPLAMETLTTRHIAFEKAYLVTSNTGTQNPIATAEREDTWQLVKASLSDIYEKYILYNEAVDAKSKNALHIHYLLGGGGGIPAPAPRTTPIVTLASKGISLLHVVYADSATPASHKKPDNVGFCEFAYKIDAPVPESPKDCPERYYVSRSNTAIVFDPEQRGRKVFGFARWVNKNSKLGPWSGLITAIVP